MFHKRIITPDFKSFLDYLPDMRKCPDLVVVKGDWEWYRRCSEGFIDMSLRNWGEDPVDVATRLKDEVKSTLGFTVNVGIGSNPVGYNIQEDISSSWRQKGQPSIPLICRSLWTL